MNVCKELAQSSTMEAFSESRLSHTDIWGPHAWAAHTASCIHHPSLPRTQSLSRLMADCSATGKREAAPSWPLPRAVGQCCASLGVSLPLRSSREFPGGLLRLDPAFAYAEPPSSWPLPQVELLTAGSRHSTLWETCRGPLNLKLIQSLSIISMK